MLGNGPAIGFGVLTQELALPGNRGADGDCRRRRGVVRLETAGLSLAPRSAAADDELASRRPRDP